MDKELLYRFFKGEIGPEEEARVLDWLDRSRENRELFEAERAVYNSIVVMAPEVIGVATAPNGQKRKLSGRMARYAAGVAAMVAVALVTGLLVRNNMQAELAAQTIKLTVPSGQRINITLSDGTVVWLNSETEIEYPVSFGKQRRVSVEGEALFDVEHDAKWPFIVETFACDVEVLGTKFNVSADSEAGMFSTALLEGRLLVSSKLSNESGLILSPMDRVDLIAGRLQISKINNDDEYRWPEGLITIGNVPFEKLMCKFEKCYDVNIVIENNNIAPILYEGKIRISDGIDHALRMLQLSSGFTYTKDENTNTVYIR